MWREFNSPLDLSQTLTVRRVITPPRVPNKGSGVYRFDTSHWPHLQANGWQFVNQNRKEPWTVYLRSPEGSSGPSFVIHLAIPTDAAILRFAAGFIQEASIPAGPGDQWGFEGHLGLWWGTFDRTVYRPDVWPTDLYRKGLVPDGKEPPKLRVGTVGLWQTELCWRNGYDNPPDWDRDETFSALVEGVPHNVDLIMRPRPRSSP